MKKRLFFVTLAVIAALYLTIRYFSDGLHENTRGVSTDVKNSKNFKTFIAEFRVVKSPILDSILGDNFCNQVWVEKTWFHRRWGNIDISNDNYTFIMDIKGVINNQNYGIFNDKWNIQLANTNNYESILNCTRNNSKYIIVGTLSQVVKLDTLTFDVKANDLNKNLGQIQFIRLQ